MLATAAAVTFVLTAIFSMAGVGAAVVLIPVFLALEVELHTAMATALLLNAIGMIVASVTFIRNGLVEWRLVVPMLIVAVLASPLGVSVARGIERAPLLWLFVGFLLFAGLMMMFYQPVPRTERRTAAQALTLGLPVGALAGFIGGLLGVGGGNIIVPALVAAGPEPRWASASASFVVIFASLAGFAAHVPTAHVDPGLLGTTAAATIAGAALGAWLAGSRLRGNQLKRVIAVVLLAVAAKTGWGLL